MLIAAIQVEGQMSDLLHSAYERSVAYLKSLVERSVFPPDAVLEQLLHFDESLPDAPLPADETLAFLDTFGSPATVASAGTRYFGFVTGGSLPIAHAVNWLVTTWDQNGALVATSPITAKLESVVLNWLRDLLGLPTEISGAFVSGATIANFTVLAAARHEILQRRGWDVESRGLFGAPEIRVIVSDEIHVSVLKALSMLGLGRDRVERVPVDHQGRIQFAALPDFDERTIVCIQAGNVNSGAFDPIRSICEYARDTGAWVHIDGAFGLWARASESLRFLCDGIELADSWTIDAHKWLNVPYDSGIALCRNPQAMRAAMSVRAAYLIDGDEREPSHYTPEFSRRARVVDIWAVLRTLGRAGINHLIEENCRLAQRFADGLREGGFTVHNEVVLNQVVVSFGSDETTQATIEAIQRDGTLWAGRTIWQGKTAMRISVSSWATTDKDVEQSLSAILRIAQNIHGE